MSELRKLSRGFYERDTITVAKDLLGCYLIRESNEGKTVGRIVEDEAYLGVTDKASHVYGGRRTRRNEPMWGPAGHAYIYLIYGMYWCLNLVTEEEGNPKAVLIRALEPVKGIEIMARRRGFASIDEKSKRNLANGPGKLCLAMGIDASLNHIDLTGDVLYVAEGNQLGKEVECGPRINVDYADDDALLPYRFMIKGSDFVSKP